MIGLCHFADQDAGQNQCATGNFLDSEKFTTVKIAEQTGKNRFCGQQQGNPIGAGVTLA